MRHILFLTGTRADFGKLKNLIKAVDDHPDFKCTVFATGMHTLGLYGYTVDEVTAMGFSKVHVYMNQIPNEPMDLVLASTIQGLAHFIYNLDPAPDMIMVHGDRVETLAGAIVGALRNVRVGHVEGGELSGTVDELMRHAVTKLSHVHFVANHEAATRLRQLGEQKEAIFIIGSPDLDAMTGPLPPLDEVTRHYGIPFDRYGIAIFHPVVPELAEIDQQAKALVDALIGSDANYVVVYPNNDEGSSTILTEYKRLNGLPNIKCYPSIRFEYFLALLKNAEFIVGNSSAGVREAPFYGLPTVNIGTRQRDRFDSPSIINTSYAAKDIGDGIAAARAMGRSSRSNHFGDGDSLGQFMAALESEALWAIPRQKRFVDMYMLGPAPHAN